MRLIIIPEQVRSSRAVRITRVQMTAAALVFCALLVGAGGFGYSQASARYEALPAELLAQWRSEVTLLREQSRELRELARQERQAYTLRLAALQASRGASPRPGAGGAEGGASCSSATG